jgi:hypothetical protein
MIQKGTKFDIWLIVIIAIMTPLDLWIDLAFMEIVRGTGDVWLFLSRDALAAVPRPPLWWGMTVLVGLITLVNEPLTAVLVKAMKQKDDWKSRNVSKKKPVSRKPTMRPTPPGERMYTPVSGKSVGPKIPNFGD